MIEISSPSLENNKTQIYDIDLMKTRDIKVRCSLKQGSLLGVCHFLHQIKTLSYNNLSSWRKQSSQSAEDRVQ